ncbi:Panacea domain-containing protein [Methanobrevibacter sp. DSM 116169]|uniref:Panacea domain-containing protein n=1 Tax=Methanobrevibacter sp. DSM 116169 TaxID=3242727 RepID=UPI0038FC787E
MNDMNEEIKLNKEKLKAVLHFIISKCGCKHNVGRTVLYKLLYFSDFNFYELYETSLTGETYIRKKNGPIPQHFKEIRNDLVDENKIEEHSGKAIDYTKYFYNSLKEPNTNNLNSSEINVINDIINKLSDKNATEISNYSHGDMPWKVTNNEEEIDYEFVFYRDDEYSVREYDE